MPQNILKSPKEKPKLRISQILASCNFCSVFEFLNVLVKRNKTPAELRDIFRPKLFYNYINLRLKNSQCTKNAKKFIKVLFHPSPYQRNPLIYHFCDSVFSLFRHYAVYQKKFSKNFLKTIFKKPFSQFLVFEVFCKGKISRVLRVTSLSLLIICN